MPIGACLVNARAAELMAPGSHGSTFGGNPLACAAALAVLEVMEAEGLDRHSEELGRRIFAGLEAGLANLAGVQSVRHKGMMFGIQLDRPCRELVTAALAEGLLINVTADSTVRLLPPLIMQPAEADWMVATVVRLVKVFLGD
jgi:acetylornithine aminotransferase